MNPKTFKIRYRVSLGLYVLGLAMPAVSTYYNRKYAISFSHFLEPYRWYQWLPFTLLFWLGASYTWTDDRIWRLITWIIFVLGILMSGLSWLYAALNS